MSSENRRHGADRELEDFLAGRSDLSRAYREAAREDAAPPSLDDAVLRLAAAPPSRRRPRWLPPLALAATFVLALGVMLRMQREEAMEVRGLPAPVTPQAEALESRVETDAATAPLADAQSAAPMMKREAAREPGSKAAQALDQPSGAASVTTPQAPLAESRRERSAKREAAAPLAEPAPPEVSSPAPAVRAQRDQAMAAEDAPESADAAGSADASPQQELKAFAAPPPPPANPAPEQWVQRIRERLARGESAAAQREVLALRAAHPDFALPADLRALANTPPEGHVTQP